MLMKLDIGRLRQLHIGHGLDNLTGAVHIDCGAWLEKYPMLTDYAIAVTRPDGEIYFAPASMHGGELEWIISAADTAVPGEGMYQVIATGAGGERRATDYYPVYVYANMPGLEDASETPPDPARGWVDEVLEAADRAENAAERAEGAAAGSVPVATPDKPGVVKPGDGLEIKADGTLNVVGGAGGEDGGYYKPCVSVDGVLSWSASKPDMPAAESANVRGPQGNPGEKGDKGEQGNAGPQGVPGEPGKSAYQYAVDGGYKGSEVDFAAKLAAEAPVRSVNGKTGAVTLTAKDVKALPEDTEIPPAYTLPTASADEKGGVKISPDFEMDGETLRLKLGKKYELIETINIEEAMGVVRTEKPDGTAYNFKAIYIAVRAAATSVSSGSVHVIATLESGSIIRGYILSNTATTYEKRGSVVFAAENGLWINAFTAMTQSDGGYISWYTNGYFNGVYPYDTHGGIVRLETAGLPAGVTLEIYGVRG